jgi:5-carboxymethyl-2-hydroxymuconate isomerase
MPLTVIDGPTGLFDPYTRDQASEKQVLNAALFGAEKTVGETEANRMKREITAQRWVARAPDFTVEANTTAAETATAIELIAQGVTFPAGSLRVIRVEAFVNGNAADETGFVQATGTISGGTTPIVRVTTVQGPSAVAGAGFAATPAVTFVAGASTLSIQVTSAEAELVHWRLHVYVGRLQVYRTAAT